MVCTFFFTALPGVEMGGFVAGALGAAVLEVGLCLAAVVRATDLHLRVGKWLFNPALASLLAGLNARLLLRILTEANFPAHCAPITALVFAAAQYTLVMRLLRKKIDESA